MPTSSGEVGRKRGFSMSSSFLMPSMTLSLRVCLKRFSLSHRARLKRRSRLVLQKEPHSRFFSAQRCFKSSVCATPVTISPLVGQFRLTSYRNWRTPHISFQNLSIKNFSNFLLLQFLDQVASQAVIFLPILSPAELISLKHLPDLQWHL